MAINDPIADFLTRIRNALLARHRFVDLDWTKMKQNLADILKQEGLIDNYLVKRDGPRGTVRLYLKYGKGRQPVIQGLKRVSRCGCRRYVTAEQIPHFFGGLGVPIVSTSQGVITGKEALKRHIGGELLCYVW